jgi:hypothetical protein
LEEAMMPTSQFIMLNDGDVIGIRHIVIITAVADRCELILSNGAKKKLTAKEGERIRSAMLNECLILPR